MKRLHTLQFLRSTAWVLLVSLLAAQHAFGADALLARYETRLNHDPDGLGKFYMGREIAQVMGHEGADWLERPERQGQERPDLLIESLKLKSGDMAADIGAGTGYYTWRMADKVGPSGLVYAVDIQAEMLDALEHNLRERKIINFRKILGTATDPKLPALSLDLVLMVDVYHEFSEPFEMAQILCRSLKPGGRLVFVEYRAEDPKVPIKAVHKMSADQVRKEMSLQSLDWVETIETLPWQHIVVFKKSDISPRK
jgi:ubiquinone/menaquinone biosynthesis C-methylase UbiE